MKEIIKMAQVEVITEEQRAAKQFEQFSIAKDEWKKKVEAIKVASVNDVAEMKQAKELRIQLRDIRVNAEKLKKALKADALAYNKAIDFCYNSIADATKPLEEELLEKEKYAENLEKERLAAIESERIDKLAQFSDFGDSIVFQVPAGLAEMSEDDFQDLLAGKRARKELAEAERKIELQKEQEAKAKAEEEQQRQLKEFEEAVKESAEKNKKLKEEIANWERKTAQIEGRLKMLIPVIEFDEGKSITEIEKEELKTVCKLWLVKLGDVLKKLDEQ